MQQTTIDMDEPNDDGKDAEQQGQQQEEKPSSTKQVESEARHLGWRPKDEWDGPDDGWRTAEEFMAVANRIDLRKQNRALKEKVEALESTIGNFTPYMEKVIAKAQAERDDAIDQLKKQQAEAVGIGDSQEFLRTSQELEKLQNEEKTEQPQTYTPEQQVFLQRNPWFGVDAELTNYANEVSNSIKARNPYLTPGQYFEALEKQVKSHFPDHFDAEPSAPRKAPKMEGGSPTSARTQRGSKKSYDDLPPDAQRMCDEFVKTIPEFTVEKYLAQYEWE